MTSINRTLPSLKRSAFTLALMLSPMIFMGAECANDPFPNAPLALNAMRAEVATEGSFVSDQCFATDHSDHWLIAAQGVVGTSERVIQLWIPKQTSVPYTVNVATNDIGQIYYCVPLMQGSCKNYYASKEQGGSGTITVTNISGTLEGTFKGVVQLSSGSETRSISSGEFKSDL